MKKEVIILEHDGGELGNQLWNYASVYAYCVERGFVCKNYSFFEYAYYFDINMPNCFLDIFFFMPFSGYKKRRSALQRRIWRKLYKFFVIFPIKFFFSKRVLSSKMEGAVYYLPPTKDATRTLKILEQGIKPIYFSFVSGGVFRNPLGLAKHRNKIIGHLKGSAQTIEKSNLFLEPLRRRFSSVVGVHVRQGDYAVFKKGKYFIEQKRVRKILDEYLSFKEILVSDVAFIVTTDGSIDNSVFDGLNVFVSPHGVGEDLFILASTDCIIGSDSTLGHFAAYYGNIPHIIMKNEPMDWEYYRDKDTYSENKYFTVSLL